MSDTPAAEQFEFQTEMGQLLHLLTHSLYTDQEIFLRELISNASDALQKLKFLSLTDAAVLGDEGNLQVELSIDEESKTLTIADNGVGMNREDLINNIGTIAKSGTSSFLEQLSGDKQKDAELIGRFGVGFYSVFMVTDKVRLTTRKYNEDQGYIWESEGKGQFSITLDSTAKRGTSISFSLKEGCQDFAAVYRLESIIKKYSDFVPFPILINGERKNQEQALWAKQKNEVSAEEYAEFFKYLAHSSKEAMHHLHLNIEAPVQLNSVLFIPAEKDDNLFAQQLDTRLSLYVKKVFIQNDCKELLPNWLRFVQGVVDSEDLPLNVSREITQKTPAMQKIHDLLTKKLLGEFKKWATKDKAKFNKFWALFGNIVKEGLHSDFTHREALIELYHFYTSKSPNTLTCFAEYKEGMSEEQKEIYYVYGKSAALIESSPNLEYFRKNDIEVIYLYEEIDDFIFPSIGSYGEVQIVEIGKADLKLNDEDKSDEEEETSPSNEKILQYFKDILGERVSDVIASKRLVDSPCTLVAPKDGLNAHMEKMMKMMDQNFEAPKRILEVNLSNPIIKNLSGIRDQSPQDRFVKDAIEQLYENAALLEGILDDPSAMSARNIAFLEQLSQTHTDTSSKGGELPD